MLHDVGNVRRLHDVLHDDRRPQGVGFRIPAGRIRKGPLPPALAQIVELLVEDVGSQDDVDDDLAEPEELVGTREDVRPELLEVIRHHEIPSDLERVLLRQALVPVPLTHGRVLLPELELHTEEIKTVRGVRLLSITTDGCRSGVYLREDLRC